MKTIATLTMLYLPATFVCSLFGTNFFALAINAQSRKSFVVSNLWWIYVATALPLTVVTLGVWFCWMKGRMRRSKHQGISD
jgi:membrane protein implicated in regulation of membrane protease activity